MSRVKRGTTSLKHRRNMLKRVKGYRFGRSTKERQAREAIVHAGTYAFAHRRDKKNVFRRLWNVKIGSAVSTSGSSYSQFIHSLKQKNITLDRKSIAGLIEFHPETFKRLMQLVK